MHIIEVALASTVSNCSIYVNAGTSIKPPPVENSPEIKPASKPIITFLIFAFLFMLIVCTLYVTFIHHLYQSVNRGSVDSAHVKLNSGSIEKFYVGGETEDSTVTGVINTVNSNLIGGNIDSLNAGTSNGSVISIDNDNFKVVSTGEVKITNDTIEDSKIKIDYDFEVSDENLTLFINKSKKLDLNIKTIPENYESVFDDIISYNCQNSAIACVSSDGVVTGMSKGNTIIEIKVGNKFKTVNVEVNDSQLLIFVGIAILMLYVIILFLIFGVYVPIW